MPQESSKVQTFFLLSACILTNSLSISWEQKQVDSLSCESSMAILLCTPGLLASMQKNRVMLIRIPPELVGWIQFNEYWNCSTFKTFTWIWPRYSRTDIFLIWFLQEPAAGYPWKLDITQMSIWSECDTCTHSFWSVIQDTQKALSSENIKYLTFQLSFFEQLSVISISLQAESR